MPAPPKCPNCGAALSPNARGCACGVGAESDWRDPEVNDDDDFDYEAFIEEEFGRKKPGMRRPSFGWGWWVVAVVLLVAFVMTTLVWGWLG